MTHTANPNTGHGHGHVRPRPDGVRARCGGPAMCRVCQQERAAIDALQSTHPADASIVGAQIDMRDSVPSAVPVGPWETKREAAGHANAMQQANDLDVALALRLADGLAGLGTMSTRLRHLYDESAAMLRAIACTAPTAPAPAQAEPVAARCKIVAGCNKCDDAHHQSGGHYACSIARRQFDGLGLPQTAPVWCPLPTYPTPPAAAAPLAQPLTDEQILTCVRSVGLIAPMGLTRDRGPYEVTEPTHYLCELVRAIERAHGIKGQP